MTAAVAKPLYDYDAGYFDGGISGWHATSFRPITDKFDEFVPEPLVGEVLDYGCGDGFYGPFLRRKAAVLDGVDYADAAQTSRFRDSYRDVYQADLGVPWAHPAGRTYDLLFSTEVVEHVVDYHVFLANAHRLLRPNGRLVFTTTTYTVYLFVMLMAYRRQVGVMSLAEFVRGYWDYAARSRFVERFADYTCGHHHGFTRRQLHTALRRVGFRVERSSYLFAQDVVHLHHLNQPYNGSYRTLVRAGVPLVRAAGATINWACRTTGAYAPNVIIVARRPA